MARKTVSGGVMDQNNTAVEGTGGGRAEHDGIVVQVTVTEGNNPLLVRKIAEMNDPAKAIELAGRIAKYGESQA